MFFREYSSLTLVSLRLGRDCILGCGLETKYFFLIPEMRCWNTILSCLEVRKYVPKKYYIGHSWQLLTLWGENPHSANKWVNVQLMRFFRISQYKPYSWGHITRINREFFGRTPLKLEYIASTVTLATYFQLLFEDGEPTIIPCVDKSRYF